MPYLALGPNQLRESAHMVTLFEIYQNKNNIINSDLEFEYDVEAQNLNERQTTKQVVIPRERIVD